MYTEVLMYYWNKFTYTLQGPPPMVHSLPMIQLRCLRLRLHHWMHTTLPICLTVLPPGAQGSEPPPKALQPTAAATDEANLVLYNGTRLS
jgi:hypothetical protein